jgi:hypothetical protein
MLSAFVILGIDGDEWVGLAVFLFMPWGNPYWKKTGELQNTK